MRPPRRIIATLTGLVVVLCAPAAASAVDTPSLSPEVVAAAPETVKQATAPVEPVAAPATTTVDQVTAPVSKRADEAPAVERVEESVAPVAKTFDEAAAPATKTVEQAAAPVAKRVDEAAAPVVKRVDENVAPAVERVAAPRADVAPAARTSVSDGSRVPLPSESSDGPRSSGSTRPQAAAAAMQGGVEERDARPGRGLGSPSIQSRGGHEDGSRAAAAAEPVASSAGASPPVATAPFIAVVAGPTSPWRARHGTEPAAKHPVAARLRVPDPRRAGVPLTTPGALRSPIATARRSSVLPTPGFGESRPVSHGGAANRTPAPSGAADGTAAAGGPAPPPTAVSALILAVLALAGAAFSVLLLPPARTRPVGFISLLERPG
jgi:hypothetical protein